MIKEKFVVLYFNPDGTELPVELKYWATYDMAKAGMDKNYLSGYYKGNYARIEKRWLEDDLSESGTS